MKSRFTFSFGSIWNSIDFVTNLFIKKYYFTFFPMSPYYRKMSLKPIELEIAKPEIAKPEIKLKVSTMIVKKCSLFEQFVLQYTKEAVSDETEGYEFYLLPQATIDIIYKEYYRCKGCDFNVDYPNPNPNPFGT
jgi:hypothetical protein